jgi:hypothetical protein
MKLAPGESNSGERIDTDVVEEKAGVISVE